MAENFVNFMGGSPLNRLSWLRPSSTFLNALVASPATRWILFKNGMPLLAARPGVPKRVMALLATDVVRGLLGPEPYFGQGQNPGEEGEATTPVLEAARLHGPRVVFLGVREPDDPDPSTSTSPESALPSTDFGAPEVAASNVRGTPYFSVDVGGLEEHLVDEVLSNATTGEGGKLTFTDPRTAMGALDAFFAAVFASARSMVDWNDRNRFCPACGSPTYSIWAGWKLSCASLLPWADNADKPPCPSGRGLQNFCHPRTDPVVITLVTNEARDKIILGRNKRFPPGFYSALAGFVEPGESYEDAVRREMWEEAGVKVWNVRYHSGQPWPFPANLMLGFYATADPRQPIRTDLDNELEDARWFVREEVLASLYATEDKRKARSETAKTGGAGEPPFKMPPPTAIAGALIKHWAEGGLVKGYL